jgi:hypothetical protein
VCYIAEENSGGADIWRSAVEGLVLLERGKIKDGQKCPPFSGALACAAT